MTRIMQKTGFLEDRIVVLRSDPGGIEELDGTGCYVHIEITAENALQIAFYPMERSPVRFVVCVRSNGDLMITANEKP
jgi:hypothetical protein